MDGRQNCCFRAIKLIRDGKNNCSHISIIPLARIRQQSEAGKSPNFSRVTYFPELKLSCVVYGLPFFSLSREVTKIRLKLLLRVLVSAEMLSFEGKFMMWQRVRGSLARGCMTIGRIDTRDDRTIHFFKKLIRCRDTVVELLIFATEVTPASVQGARFKQTVLR